MLKAKTDTCLGLGYNPLTLEQCNAAVVDLKPGAALDEPEGQAYGEETKWPYGCIKTTGSISQYYFASQYFAKAVFRFNTGGTTGTPGGGLRVCTKSPYIVLDSTSSDL